MSDLVPLVNEWTDAGTGGTPAPPPPPLPPLPPPPLPPPRRHVICLNDLVECLLCLCFLLLLVLWLYFIALILDVF